MSQHFYATNKILLTQINNRGGVILLLSIIFVQINYHVSQITA